ncbi:MAG: hypothetical protein H8D26_01665 [Methanomicrobia archaeon]|nr:hypothetical protein [Methanomicrobia archaeon]
MENKPPSLPPALKDSVSMLYKASCNEITGGIWFTDVPSVKEILKEIRELEILNPKHRGLCPLPRKP